jgi:membrane associated rhomboid family serine protease
MHEPVTWCSLLLIAVTCAVSYAGFRSREVEEKYIFRPESILAGKEYYRLVTSAFLHSGWSHLIWNMVGLYLFGRLIELSLGVKDLLLIYFGSVIGGDLLSLYVHRHHDYLSYGASGGVSGIVFAFLLLFPGASIGWYFVVPIPGWLYAVGFMVGSFVALKKAKDNIGHDAHLGGAIVGLLIAAALHPQAARYNWTIFLLVLVPAILLLVWLWRNPLFLSTPSFFGLPFEVKRRRSQLPAYKQESKRVDALLEKIARNGVDSLTAEEKAFLERVSERYRRREQSRKPESGLAI